MKRYLIFAGSEFYPSGGMYDYYTSTDDKEHAVVCACDRLGEKTEQTPIMYGGMIIDWAHVYDMEQGKVIFRIANGGERNWYGDE